VKSIIARATLISLFLGLAVVPQAHAEEYYIYQPEDPQAQETGKTQLDGQIEDSPKPSKNK
jgi:hypothetical protein